MTGSPKSAEERLCESAQPVMPTTSPPPPVDASTSLAPSGVGARADGLAALAGEPTPVAPPATLIARASPPEKNVPPPPPSVLHPRGRIWPTLSRRAPMWRRFIRGVVRLAQGIYHHDDIFQMAPAMAFHFFLSFLPLLVFVGYLIGLVAQYKGASSMLGLLLDNVPATTEAMLKDEVSGLTTAKRLGPVAAIGFFWIASGGTQGLMQAIERVVGVPPRKWWRQRLFAFAWVLGTIVAIGAASLSIVQWDNIIHLDEPASAPNAEAPLSAPTSSSTAFDEHDGDHVDAVPTTPRHAHHMAGPARRARKILRDGGERILAIVLSVVAAVGGLAAFYHFAVAHSRRVRRRTLPGAVVAIALVIIISWGFSLYVRTLASYTVYYGSLAAIAVLLVWLWLMSIAILIGAELNSQLEGLRDLPRPPSLTNEIPPTST